MLNMMEQKLNEVLERARLIISSHGMSNYMPSYAKSTLVHQLHESCDKISYDFMLDPKKSSYSNDNFICTLNVSYAYDCDIERDEGIYRDYMRRISIRIGGGDVSLQMLKNREDMIESIKMLMEMIEVSIPKKIVHTVMTPSALKAKRQKAYEQQISSQIFSIVGKDAVRNVRTGGRPKISVLSQKYAEVYGSMPQPGKYHFDYVKNRNRRGYVTDRASIIFIVENFNDSLILKAFRTD